MHMMKIGMKVSFSEKTSTLVPLFMGVRLHQVLSEKWKYFKAPESLNHREIWKISTTGTDKLDCLINWWSKFLAVSPGKQVVTHIQRGETAY